MTPPAPPREWPTTSPRGPKCNRLETKQLRQKAVAFFVMWRYAFHMTTKNSRKAKNTETHHCRCDVCGEYFTSNMEFANHCSQDCEKRDLSEEEDALREMAQILAFLSTHPTETARGSQMIQNLINSATYHVRELADKSGMGWRC